MDWLLDPLSAGFFLRALAGGALAAAVCALVGTWVVARGMAFLGEALAHGMLPGVAVAGLIGAPVVAGAAVSAVVMSLGVGALARRARLSHDTSIGILFVGMLALGVAIVSHSRSFAVDLTAILFGDVLAVRAPELILLAVGLAITVVVTVLGHRAFVALSFDPRVAQTLGFRPRVANLVLIGLVTLAVVVSYQAIGTLLVVGLLLAPPAAARMWASTLPSAMLLAVILGTASTVVGLYLSWHLGTAAGATIAGVAVALFALSVLTRSRAVAS